MHASAVDPLPANGSNTTAPGCVVASISIESSATGFSVGCTIYAPGTFRTCSTSMGRWPGNAKPSLSANSSNSCRGAKAAFVLPMPWCALSHTMHDRIEKPAYWIALRHASSTSQRVKHSRQPLSSKMRYASYSHHMNGDLSFLIVLFLRDRY